MKNFIIYDASGSILRVGCVPEEYLNLQAQEGEFLIEGSAKPDTDRVDVKTKEIIKIVHATPSDSEVLLELQLKKSAEIDNACRLKIVSGFKSSALGGEYFYPSKVIDQQNLAASVLASYDPTNSNDWLTPFWCADIDGNWDFRPHTASQIREVGRDAKSAILGYQFHNEQLQTQIKAASTKEQLDAITW